MIRIYSGTEKNLRETNQDRYSCMRFGLRNGENVWSLAVSDGMGGLAAGEIYAQEALCAVQKYVAETVFLAEQELSGGSCMEINDAIVKMLETSANSFFEAINKEVREKTQEQGLEHGGATVSLCVVTGDTLQCFNIGDSPIYMRRNRSFTELGVRDNAAEMMVRKGTLTREEKDRERYEKESSGLLYFIGSGRETVTHYCRKKLESGDAVVIGSDGAFGFMNGPDWLDKLFAGAKASELIGRMYPLAKRTTGDNQTAIVFEYHDSEKQMKGFWPFKAGGKA